jgi:hypothetical protein
MKHRYLILLPIEVRSDVNIHHVGAIEVYYGSKDDKTNEAPVKVYAGDFQIKDVDETV